MPASLTELDRHGLPARRRESGSGVLPFFIVPATVRHQAVAESWSQSTRAFQRIPERINVIVCSLIRFMAEFLVWWPTVHLTKNTTNPARDVCRLVKRRPHRMYNSLAALYLAEFLPKYDRIAPAPIRIQRILRNHAGAGPTHARIQPIRASALTSI